MLAPRVKIMAPPLKVIDNFNSNNIWENKLQRKIMLIFRARIDDLILKVPTWVTFEE
jgi:hypothetical protein